MRQLEDILAAITQLDNRLQQLEARIPPKTVLPAREIAQQITEKLPNYAPEIEQLKKSLAEIVAVAAKIASNTRVETINKKPWSIDSKSIGTLLIFGLILGAAIILSPGVNQTYREAVLSKKVEQMQAEIDYFRMQNPKTARKYFSY